MYGCKPCDPVCCIDYSQSGCVRWDKADQTSKGVLRYEQGKKGCILELFAD